MATVVKTALNHFDKFYPYVYTNSSWKSIRLGLLCKAKKMFLLNNNCSLKNIDVNLQKNGAINFLDNLMIKEKIVDNSIDDYLYLKHNTISKGVQLNEFIKSKEYIGERSIYTKSISNSFTNYISDNLNEQIAEEYFEKLTKCQSEMLPYEPIDIPKQLSVLAYPKAVIRKPFPLSYDEYNQSAFYPIDGFSILVVLFMNVRQGDRVLDMCSAPGGKAVALLQTGLLGELVCIDESPARVGRLKAVLKSHLSTEDIADKVTIITGNSVHHGQYMENYFDKVLLDAPCSADRHAIADTGFSLFAYDNRHRKSELHHRQQALLRAAIKSCKIGGDIVYSTCTLSPVQNEKIILSVIDDVNSKNSSDFHVKIVHIQSDFYNMHPKYGSGERSLNDWFTSVRSLDTLGQVILPNILNNYGPGYICKLRKVAI